MSQRSSILVAGKSGQLARCLAEEAALRGVPLMSAGRPELDLADAESVERAVAAVAPRAIVNAAAYTAVDKAEAEPALAFAINEAGAARLAGAAARHGVPFVHVSTDYVFDGASERPYREDDTPAPLNVYGRSKLAGEIAVRNACPSSLVLRTSWLYSRFSGNFVTSMLRLSSTHDRVRVVDDQHGAPTATADLARAILDIVERLAAAEGKAGRGGVFHLTASGETSWHGFAKAIVDLMPAEGKKCTAVEPITTAEYPLPAKRPAFSVLSCEKLTRTFGLQLPAWEESLKQVLEA